MADSSEHTFTEAENQAPGRHRGGSSSCPRPDRSVAQGEGRGPGSTSKQLPDSQWSTARHPGSGVGRNWTRRRADRDEAAGRPLDADQRPHARRCRSEGFRSSSHPRCFARGSRQAVALDGSARRDGAARFRSHPEAAGEVQTESEALRELFRRTAGNRIWEIVHPEDVREADVSPDCVAELQHKWRTAPGQLWGAELNRVKVGDSTNESIVADLWRRSERRFRNILTDPAYGIAYADKNLFK